MTKPLTDAQINQQIILSYGMDPILAARQLLPHWFKRPMQWFHRGAIAILLRRADFLLNFSEPGRPEIWPEGTKHWTKKDLAKIVKHFTYKVNPADRKSPTAPIFRIRYAEDGRTPVGIDMVLGQNVAIIWPRGFAKTTIINFINIYKTLYRLTKFTVYVSEAAPHAEDQLATVRRELSSNVRIWALFGQLKPDRTDDETWGAKGFETKTGVKFAAKGRGAQIRGLNRQTDRPDCIVLDDVEDLESISTDTQRDKTTTWLAADVEQATDRDNPNSCIYAIGTLLGDKAMMAVIIKDPTYTSIKFGAAVPTGKVIDTGEKNPDGTPKVKPVLEPLWDDPAGLSLKALEAKKQAMAAKGKLYNFYLEFMSEVRDDTKTKFKQEYIRYRTLERKDFVAVSIHVDPAIGKGRENCYATIGVVGIMENGHKHVCEFWAEQGVSVFELAEAYFEIRMRWQCTHHSCESTAYQAALAQVIRSLMFKKAAIYGSKAYFEILDTWPHGRKIERVEGILQPIMAAGYLTFQQIWPLLETMFIDWPNGDLDGPDVLAGAVANLEPFSALSYGDSDKLEKEQTEPLDYEAPCAAGSGVVP